MPYCIDVEYSRSHSVQRKLRNLINLLKLYLSFKFRSKSTISVIHKKNTFCQPAIKNFCKV